MPGEPVLFLGDQYFDVPFYLGLNNPVQIFDSWKQLDGHDNWHKALQDAGKFDPAIARVLLRDRTELTYELCAHPVSWVVATKDAASDYPVLQSSQVLSQNYASVWRVSQKEIAAKGLCPGTPIVGLIDR